MAENFYTILTNLGKAQIANASALGSKVNFSTLVLGDSNGAYYNPTETQNSLVHEVWKGPIGNVIIDKDNSNWIALETVIPTDVGGFMIREVGILDDKGNLLAVGKYPETYKPALSEGSAKDLRIRIVLEVTNTAAVTLKVDPSIILATKKDLEILQNNINNIKVPVTSVNGQTGKIELKAADIKTENGGTVESHLAENMTQINNLSTNKAEKTALDITNTSVTNLQNSKADISYVNTKTQANNLAYKESYTTLSALQAAYPTGNAYNHVVLADGMIYTWVNSSWINTNVQANGTGNSDNSITHLKLAGDVSFMDYIYNLGMDKLTSGKYIDESGNILDIVGAAISGIYDVDENHCYKIYTTSTYPNYPSFYNDSNAFISRGTVIETGDNYKVYKLPSGARKVKFTIYTNPDLPAFYFSESRKNISGLSVSDEDIEYSSIKINKINSDYVEGDNLIALTDSNISLSGCYLENGVLTSSTDSNVKTTNYINLSGKKGDVYKIFYDDYTHGIAEFYDANNNFLFAYNSYRNGGDGYFRVKQDFSKVRFSFHYTNMNNFFFKKCKYHISDLLIKCDNIYNEIAKKKYAGKKIGFLGDSITFGFGLANNKTERFSKLLCDALGATEYNYGVASATISTVEDNNFVSRYSSMSDDLDLIFVFGGTNDYWHNLVTLGDVTSTDTTTFNGALNTLIKELINKYPTKKICFITPYSQQFGSETSDTIKNISNSNLKGFVDCIKARCSEHGIKVIDLFTEGGWDIAHNNSQKAHFTQDGVHLNVDGHIELANTLYYLSDSI